MPDKTFILDLAKLVIAAAWVDGELAREEISALKDLFYTLPDITGDEWELLEVYMDSPVTSEEREDLISSVLAGVKSEADRTYAIDILTRLFKADGKVTDEEDAVLQEIKRAFENAHIGLFGKMKLLIMPFVAKRKQAFRVAIPREDRIDDYIMNTIYYKLESELQQKGMEIKLPERQIRKLCCIAGLLARIAWVDAGISDNEKIIIKSILCSEWALSEPQGRLFTEISCRQAVKGLDENRLAREFYDCTSLDERVKFLDCLFRVANASNRTSPGEIEEIRRVSNLLKLSHQEFMEAQHRIPREDRKDEK